MSQVNSGIGTKACTYDFSKNGALGLDGGGLPVYSFAGISIKPGEAILDIKCTLGSNLMSGGGGATQFSFGLGPNPNPVGSFFTMFLDSLTNINTYVFNMYQSPLVNLKFSDNISVRWPVAMTASSSLWFGSSAALTAGKVHFIVTYQFAKF